MSTAQPNSTPSQQSPAESPAVDFRRAPLAENPWLWLMLFGGMGVAAILVVGPKYAARTTRVERMQATRERVAAERRSGPASTTAAGTEVPPPGRPPSEPYVDADFVPPTRLSWLLALMAVAMVVGTAGLLVSRRRGGPIASSNSPVAESGA